MDGVGPGDGKVSRRSRPAAGGRSPPGAEPAIVLTLQMDPVAQARLDGLRRAHFPPTLDKVPAHLTLFHALPGDRLEAVVETVACHAAATRPFDLVFDRLLPLGRGVALGVDCEPLGRFREALATTFRPWLTGQDRERFRPHVTIQNKVTPERAKATLEALARRFEPIEATAEGVQLWRYLGGPWAPAGAIGFARRH